MERAKQRLEKQKQGLELGRENEKGNHKELKKKLGKGLRKFELVDGSFRSWALLSGAPGGVSGVITSALES